MGEMTPEREKELREYAVNEEPASMQRDWFACTLRRDGRRAAADLLAALDAARRERDAARDLYEKSMVIIHEAAGIRRDGLAGILAWIDEAKDALVQVDEESRR